MSVSSFYDRKHITSVFGDGRNGGRKHRGVDFSHSRTPGASAVPSLLSGKVISKLAPASWHGFGHQVTIESSWEGAAVRFSYAHLHAASGLKVGQSVSAGQIVGHEGRSGWTTGPCVHIELQRSGSFRNPAPTIEAIRTYRPAAPAKPAANSDVKWVQERLGAHGFGVVVDGKRGPLTIDATKRFQRARKLAVDGIVGPKTRAALQAAPPSAAPATLRRGSKGAKVKELQRVLKSRYPLYAGKLAVDGDFGPGTERAVREFQRRSGLAVDGIAGSATLGKLGIR